DDRDLVGKLVRRRHANVDGTGRYGVNDLVIREELRLVEDLDGDGALGLLLHLGLEALEAAAEDRVGERKLQIDLQRDLLGGRLLRRDQRWDQQRYQPHIQQARHHGPQVGTTTASRDNNVTWSSSKAEAPKRMHRQRRAVAAMP